jgi:FkbM family methyltransferase
MLIKRAQLLLLTKLRPLTQRFPQLVHFGRKVGVNRWLKGGELATVMLDGNVTVQLDLSVKGFRYLYYIYDLQHSPEIALIRLFSAPQGSFIDVGANIGYFSLVAAKYYSHVVAFEPSRATSSQFEHNLKLNPGLAAKITLHKMALGSEAGQSSLFRPMDQPLAASLRPVREMQSVIETVSVNTLDNMITRQDEISFLKLDVEGAEFEVLKGGEQVIQQYRPAVLCELSESMQNRFGHSSTDIMRYFASIDYVVYLVNERTDQSDKLLTQLDTAFSSKDALTNVLFVPREKNARLIMCPHG